MRNERNKKQKEYALNPVGVNSRFLLVLVSENE